MKVRLIYNLDNNIFSFTQIKVMQKLVHPTESLWSKAKF